MRNLRIKASFLMLPIFFFILSVSPNISGERIGLVLVSIYLLLIPATTHLGRIDRKDVISSDKTNHSIKNLLAILLILGSVYLGWKISWQYSLTQILFAVIVSTLRRNLDLFKSRFAWYLYTIIYALALFTLLYLGLNQYSFEILLSVNNLVLTILTISIVLVLFYLDRLDHFYQSGGAYLVKKLTFVLIIIALQVLAFGIYFMINSQLLYVLYFLLAILIPAIILLLTKKQLEKGIDKNFSKNINGTGWLLATSQMLFFLYYFLETTQVLQAIQGGY